MTRYARTPEVIETAVDDELFVVLSGGEEIFHLDAIAAAIWRALAEPAGEAELERLLEAAFPDVPARQIAADVTTTLDRLSRNGLLVTADN